MKKENSVKNSTMRQLLRYLKPHPVLAILSILFALTYVIGLILAPIFIGNAIDYIIDENQVNLSRVLTYSIYLLITILAAAISNYLTTSLSARLSQKVTAKIRQDTIKKISNTPLDKLSNLSNGELAIRISTDCERIAEGLTSAITQIFTFFALITGTLVFMFRLNITLALIIALLSPLSVLAASIIAYFSRKMLIKQTAIEGDLAKITEEYLHSACHQNSTICHPDLEHSKQEHKFDTTQSNQKENTKHSFIQHSQNIKKIGGKATFFASLTIPTTRFINGIIFAVVAIVGAYLVLGEVYFSIGMLMIFLTYTIQFTRPFNDINATISDIQVSIVSAKRVFGVAESNG